MSQWWVLLRGGDVVATVCQTASPGAEQGIVFDRAVGVDRPGDPAVERFDGKGWVEDAGKVEAALVAAIKVEAERRKMLVRSPGAGKSAEYRQKRNEALESQSVTASVLNALTTPAAMSQYPAAAMEAARTGERIAVVLARYQARVAASDTETFRLAAVEQAAVAAIKAASSPAAKRAAAAAANWAWQP